MNSPAFTTAQDRAWGRRRAWLIRVGQATQAHREGRARELDRKAAAARAHKEREGWGPAEQDRAASWYEGRARGQRERVERVETCGEVSTVEVTCQACGEVRDRPTTCGVRALCRSCRGTTGEKKRAQFRASRVVLLDQAERQGLINPRRRGGRYSEKLLTLTAPHVGDVGERIERIQLAVPCFLKSLRRLWRERGVMGCAYYLAHEWTSGADGQGHPHCHVWLFCPYLDRGELARLWRAALEGSGLPPGTPLLVPDVRAGGVGVADELVKYLTKDVAADGGEVPAEIYAQVYAAYDGRRVTQASAGFIALGARARACACGAVGCFTVRVVSQPRAEGVPLVEGISRPSPVKTTPRARGAKGKRASSKCVASEAAHFEDATLPEASAPAHSRRAMGCDPHEQRR